MRSRLVIIAGPQSSGKTTACQILKKYFPDLIYLSEITPFTFFGKRHLGGAFVDKNMEEKIIRTDLVRLKKLKPTDKIYLQETGVFHLVYSKLHGWDEMATCFLTEYQKALSHFSVGILFFDTKPSISWQRRRDYYFSRAKGKPRGERKKLVQKYRLHLKEIYPCWLELYQKLPYSKIRVPNSGRNLKYFERKLIEGFKIILANFSSRQKNLFRNKWLSSH